MKKLQPFLKKFAIAVFVFVVVMFVLLTVIFICTDANITFEPLCILR